MKSAVVKAEYHEFSDGHAGWMSEEDAQSYKKEHKVSRLRNYVRYDGVKELRTDRKDDAWRPHYSVVMGQYFDDKKKWQSEVKRRGLKEYGTGPLPQQKAPKRKSYLTNECITELKERGFRGIDDSWVKQVQHEQSE